MNKVVFGTQTRWDSKRRDGTGQNKINCLSYYRFGTTRTRRDKTVKNNRITPRCCKMTNQPMFYFIVCIVQFNQLNYDNPIQSIKL